MGGRFPGGQPRLFQGLLHDPVTGLAYARNRWYDPRNATWLSEDPAGAVDSQNLYAFVGWQPSMGRDPMGRWCMRWLGDEETRCTDWFPAIAGGSFRRQRIDLLGRANDDSLSLAERNRAAMKANFQILPWLLEETGTIFYNSFVHRWAAEWDESTDVEQRFAELEEQFPDADPLELMGQMEEEGYGTRYLVKGGAPGPPSGRLFEGFEASASRLPVRAVDELFGQTAFAEAMGAAPEVVRGFKIFGNKGPVGASYQRNILFLEAEEVGSRSPRALLRAFEEEALDVGAEELRILGHAVINKKLLNRELAEKLGYTFRQITDDTVELVKAFD